MFETYNTILVNSFRNFKRNVLFSPALYFLFSIMMFFSILFIGFLTFFFIRNDVFVDINDVFFIIFFIFLLKASYDFYNYFTKSYPVTYLLSTQVSQIKTVFEIFLVVFWTTLGLWVLFFSLYSFSLIISSISLAFPLLYIKFTFGIILGIILGSIIVLHYFSKKKYRLIPIGFVFYFIYVYDDIFSILFAIFVSFIYLLISMKFCLDSFQFVNRKSRKKEKPQVWLANPIKTVFYKEITILWRERVLFSVLFSAVFMGIVTGYIALFGAGDFLPESLRFFASRIAPESYAFFGIYVLTIHGAVFVSLSFFLNEEKTLWLIHHLPVKIKTYIYGKALALTIPFLCSIPFIAYYSAFTKGESLLFLIWFLIFSYLAAIIICFPLGAKYVGKKSDILLLYSVSLLIFAVLGFSFSLNSIFKLFNFSSYFFYVLIILIEFVFLILSFNISERLLVIKYKNT